MSVRVVVLPPVPALLPAYRGRHDPVAGLRTACHAAVAWLAGGEESPVTVLADPPDEAARRRGTGVPLGLRVARDLLAGVAVPGRLDEVEARHGEVPDRRLLVLANGSGCRSEKAPGHLDPRAFDFDERIEKALARGDNAVLAGLDAGLGRDLLAAGVEQLRRLGAMGLDVRSAELLYADDPYGVRYWVATWQITT